MESLSEKRKLAAEWVNNAEEAEIDILLESVLYSQKVNYSPDVIRKLDERWENYVSGKRTFTTPEKLRKKLLKN